MFNVFSICLATFCVTFFNAGSLARERLYGFSDGNENDFDKLFELADNITAVYGLAKPNWRDEALLIKFVAQYMDLLMDLEELWDDNKGTVVKVFKDLENHKTHNVWEGIPLAKFKTNLDWEDEEINEYTRLTSTCKEVFDSVKKLVMKGSKKRKMWKKH